MKEVRKLLYCAQWKLLLRATAAEQKKATVQFAA
jgi:hypothetical protein